MSDFKSTRGNIFEILYQIVPKARDLSNNTNKHTLGCLYKPTGFVAICVLNNIELGMSLIETFEFTGSDKVFVILSFTFIIC